MNTAGTSFRKGAINQRKSLAERHAIAKVKCVLEYTQQKINDENNQTKE